MAGFFDQFSAKNTTIFDDESNILLTIDAVPEEEHVLTSDETKHEVESGAVFADHLIKRPRSLTIKGVISDDNLSLISSGVTTSAGLVGNIFQDVRGVAPLLSGVSSIITDELLSERFKPSITALEFFEEIHENKKLVFIITGLKTYFNMALKSLTVPRTPQNSRTLTFTAIFKQIMISNTSSFVLSGPTQNKDSIQQVKDGVKQTETPSEQIQERGSSLLRKIQGLF